MTWHEELRWLGNPTSGNHRQTTKAEWRKECGADNQAKRSLTRERMIALKRTRRQTSSMSVDTFAAFYARYVEFCTRAGIEPVAPDKAAAILTELGPLAPIPILMPPADRLEGGNRH